MALFKSHFIGSPERAKKLIIGAAEAKSLIGQDYGGTMNNTRVAPPIFCIIGARSPVAKDWCQNGSFLISLFSVRWRKIIFVFQVTQPTYGKTPTQASLIINQPDSTMCPKIYEKLDSGQISMYQEGSFSSIPI